MRHTVERDVYGGLNDAYAQSCSRTYPGGPAACEGATAHHTNNPQSAYSPPTSYTREFACRITPVGGRCYRQEKSREESGYSPPPTPDTGWRTAEDQPQPDCYDRLKRAPAGSDSDGDGVPDVRDRCPGLKGQGSADGCPASKPRCTGGLWESKATITRRAGAVLSYGVDLFWCWDPKTKQIEIKQTRPIANADLGGTTDQFSLSNLERTLRDVFVFTFRWREAPVNVETESRSGGRKLVTVSSGTFEMCSEVGLPIGLMAKAFKLKIGRPLDGAADKKLADISARQRAAFARLLDAAWNKRVTSYFAKARAAQEKKLLTRWSKTGVTRAERDALLKAHTIKNKSRFDKAGTNRYRVRKQWAKPAAARAASRHRAGEEKVLREVMSNVVSQIKVPTEGLIPCLPVWQPQITAQIGRGGIEFTSEDGYAFSMFGKKVLDIADPA